MAVQGLSTPRFLRKTKLRPNEYNTKFHMLDRQAVTVVTSIDADRITPLMSKVYLRLRAVPDEHWESDGVLRITGESREGKWVTAWEQLCGLLGVSSATARKALSWMHEQAVIGYYAGKNGVGIRIFINRAAESIAVRKVPAGKKNLDFPPASPAGPPTSPDEAALNDSFAVTDTSDPDINSRAPKNGANKAQVDKLNPETTLHISANQLSSTKPCTTISETASVLSLNEIVLRLKAELEPAMQTAARNAAAHEHERTREWLENRGLPKAARVAQHEAYSVLRKYGVISESSRTSRTHADVGRSDYVPSEPHALTHDEIADLAGGCVALLETRGQSIELTLSEMSTEAGGFLLPEDACRVRDVVNALLSGSNGREGN
jgi:hypothetical protein